MRDLNATQWFVLTQPIRKSVRTNELTNEHVTGFSWLPLNPPQHFLFKNANCRFISALFQQDYHYRPVRNTWKPNTSLVFICLRVVALFYLSFLISEKQLCWWWPSWQPRVSVHGVKYLRQIVYRFEQRCGCYMYTEYSQLLFRFLSVLLPQGLRANTYPNTAQKSLQ